jgi:hypothetical protein
MENKRKINLRKIHFTIVPISLFLILILLWTGRTPIKMVLAVTIFWTSAMVLFLSMGLDPETSIFTKSERARRIKKDPSISKWDKGGRIVLIIAFIYILFYYSLPIYIDIADACLAKNFQSHTCIVSKEDSPVGAIGLFYRNFTLDYQGFSDDYSFYFSVGKEIKLGRKYSVVLLPRSKIILKITPL